MGNLGLFLLFKKFKIFYLFVINNIHKNINKLYFILYNNFKKKKKKKKHYIHAYSAFLHKILTLYKKDAYLASSSTTSSTIFCVSVAISSLSISFSSNTS